MRILQKTIDNSRIWCYTNSTKLTGGGGVFNYMEREILFRGKSVNDGCWYHGSYLRMDKTTYCFTEDYDGVNNTEHFIVVDQMTDWGLPNNHKIIEVDPETVGEFTGLLDKDNNRIFEGDVLIFGDTRIVVYWDGERFSWMAKKAVEYPYRKFPDYDDWDYIDLGWIAAEIPCLGKMTTQIVGNIYDNPEKFVIEHDENMMWEDF